MVNAIKRARAWWRMGSASIVLGALTAVVVLALARGSVFSDDPPLVGASATPGALTRPFTPQELGCINGFEGSVDAFLHLPSPQRAAGVRLIEACAKAREHPLSLAGVPGRPTSAPDSQPTPTSIFPSRSAGAGTIVEEGEGPFPARTLIPQNVWHEQEPGRATVVYAGSRPDDPSQGWVVVMVDDGGTVARSLIGGPDAYPTPGKDGAVEIVNAVGDMLKLQAKDGRTFYFDVTARTFLSALPVAIPTPIPTP